MSNQSIKQKRSRTKTIINVITLIAMVVLIYLVRHQIAEVYQNLTRVNVWVLLLILPLQFLNYDAYARMYRRFFAIVGETVRYKDMFKVTLELNFVNHVFPSGGVTGISYFSLRMKSYGVSVPKSTLAQVIKFGLLFVSFQVLLFIGLFSLAIMGKANNLMILVAGSLATLVAVGTIVMAYVLQRKSRINAFLTFITKLLNRLIHIIRPKHPETINVTRAQKAFNELHDDYQLVKKDLPAIKKLFWFGLIANTTEVLTIYVVYVAFGQWVNIGAVILAYAIANFAGLVSVLPGGVGIYEALMTTVLAAAGVPPALSLPVTVMYRVLNMSVQLIPGYYFYHKAVQGRGFNELRTD